MNYVERYREWRHANPGRVAEFRRRYKDRNAAKHNARKMVYNWVSRGKMVRPTNCQVCGISCHTEAHHKDYSKPLEVTWLCRNCHLAQHGKGPLKEAKTTPSTSVERSQLCLPGTVGPVEARRRKSA